MAELPGKARQQDRSIEIPRHTCNHVHGKLQPQTEHRLALFPANGRHILVHRYRRTVQSDWTP